MRRLYPRTELVASPSGGAAGAAHCARLGRMGFLDGEMGRGASPLESRRGHRLPQFDQRLLTNAD